MVKETEIAQGKIRGIAAADPRIISYKGIPYAEPPVGKLRWRAPQPHHGWDGVRDCFQFSPIPCQTKPQPGISNIYDLEWNVDKTIPMDEDCLTLNVWTPAKDKNEKLPVYFWIYGGGLQWGNSAEMEFDGERIARRGIVVVTINYRLNVFGFFASNEKDADGKSVERNIGNRDQAFALKWVYENIAAFGGDPEHIVIGGQSAGGGSVLTQLNYPENKKYIKGAVVESGYFKNPYIDHFNFPSDLAEKQSEEFLKFLGAKNIDEAKAMTWEQVRDANDSFQKMWFGLTGNDFTRTGVEQAISEKTFIDVPMLHGWTDNEFFGELEASSKEEFEAKAREVYGADADRFLELMKKPEGAGMCSKENNPSKFNSVEFGNIAFTRLRKASGFTSKSWIYEFGPYMPGGDEPGAFHSSDLWFFFETLAKCWRPFDGKYYDLSRKMCNYLCNFIKTLDPNGKDTDPEGTALPEWKNYTDETPCIMNFKTQPEAETRVPDEKMEFYLDWAGKKARG
ncbi:MAG: carboxylesterase family protein [Treponema sp.]|nr:carboxylesterase family protein [Treponema sp.]